MAQKEIECLLSKTPYSTASATRQQASKACGTAEVEERGEWCKARLVASSERRAPTRPRRSRLLGGPAAPARRREGGGFESWRPPKTKTLS